jgi:hypothetical protein
MAACLRGANLDSPQTSSPMAKNHRSRPIARH